mmetsp:Transcript_2223/g.5241  ORF Transcript_2223/g.5241 Transcript_2223/m.5241 type:complete len:402 (+) Transcript_2223:238-1443(+)
MHRKELLLISSSVSPSPCSAAACAWSVPVGLPGFGAVFCGKSSEGKERFVQHLRLDFRVYTFILQKKKNRNNGTCGLRCCAVRRRMSGQPLLRPQSSSVMRMAKALSALHGSDELLGHRLFLFELRGGGVHKSPGALVDGQPRHDGPLSPHARHREGVHEPRLNPVRSFSPGRHHAHRDPRASRRAVDPVAHVVAHRRRRGKRRGQLARGDDGGSALLHRGDELPVQICVVAYGLADGYPSRLAVVDVWVLRRGVVAPDYAVLDVAHRHPRLLRHLPQRAIVVQTREAGDVLSGNLGRVVAEDERVGVGGVGHHHHLAPWGGMLLQGAGLAFVDGHVLTHHLLALHPGASRKPAHHYGHVHSFTRLCHVNSGHDSYEERVRGVHQLHGHALERCLRRGDVQ